MGEELDCERELNNAHDHYAVAVKRMEVVVGHLPCKLSRLCLLVHVLEIYENRLGRLLHSIASSLAAYHVYHLKVLYSDHIIFSIL